MMRKVTNIWQDSKIPNEIPPLALLLRSFLTSQKFGFGVPPSLRMTQRDFISYKVLEFTMYYK